MSFFAEQIHKATPDINSVIGAIQSARQRQVNYDMYQRLQPILQQMTGQGGTTLKPTRSYSDLLGVYQEAGVDLTEAIKNVMGYFQTNRENAQKERQLNIEEERVQGMNKPVIKQEPQEDGKIHDVVYSGFDQSTGQYANRQVLGVSGTASQNAMKTTPQILMGDDNLPHKFEVATDASGNVVKKTDLGKTVMPGTGGNLKLTPEAMDMLARQYLQSGVMPSVGFGNQGILLKSQLFNYAAQLGGGANVAANKAAYDSNKAALQVLTRQAAGVNTYSRTAEDNLNLALKQSAQLPRTGSPIANRFVQWFQRGGAGLPNLTKFEVYIYTAAREYAKVTGGGSLSTQGLTDSANQEAQKLINAAMNPEQFRQAVTAMRDDMRNVRYELDQSVNEYRDRISSFGTTNQPSAPNQNQSGISQDERQQAIDWIKANPNDPRAAQIKERLGIQ